MTDEKPILFAGAMVRALLNTKPGVWPAEPIDPCLPWKWQTRRVITGAPPCPDGWYADRYDHSDDWAFWGPRNSSDAGRCTLPLMRCPYHVGQVRWVRETHCWLDEHINGVKRDDPVCVGFPADGSIYRFEPEPLLIAIDHLDDYGNYKLRPSISLPRWACRLRLEVKEVRCQLVQEISNVDALAEGINREDLKLCHVTPTACYRKLWDSINAKRGFAWASNPWVWAVSLMRL